MISVWSDLQSAVPFVAPEADLISASHWPVDHYRKTLLIGFNSNLETLPEG